MSIKSRIAAASVLGAFLLLTACSKPSSGVGQSNLKPAKDRKAAPDFTLKDADGRAVSLSDYKGKVIVLNFWATWCGPCKIEIPWFVDFEQRHKDKDFAVVGVSMDEEGWDVVKPFIKEYGVNYRMLMGNDLVAQQYGGVESLPTTFVIDREGRVASVHIGLVSRREYENDIQELFSNP